MHIEQVEATSFRAQKVNNLKCFLRIFKALKFQTEDINCWFVKFLRQTSS